MQPLHGRTLATGEQLAAPEGHLAADGADNVLARGGDLQPPTLGGKHPVGAGGHGETELAAKLIVGEGKIAVLTGFQGDFQPDLLDLALQPPDGLGHRIAGLGGEGDRPPAFGDGQLLPLVDQVLGEGGATFRHGPGTQLLHAHIVALHGGALGFRAGGDELQPLTVGHAIGALAPVQDLFQAELGVEGHAVDGLQGVVDLELIGLQHHLVVGALVCRVNGKLADLDQQPADFAQRAFGGLHHSHRCFRVVDGLLDPGDLRPHLFGDDQRRGAIRSAVDLRPGRQFFQGFDQPLLVYRQVPARIDRRRIVVDSHWHSGPPCVLAHGVRSTASRDF